MPIVQVRLPDGRVVSVHAEPRAEEPNPIKQAGASLLAGFGKMASGVPKAASMLIPWEEDAAPIRQWGEDASRFWTEFGNKHGFEPGYKRAFAEGAGGGLINPSIGPLRSALVGAAGGGGAEAGQQVVDHPLGAVIGGVLAGGAAGLAAGPRQSVAHQDIRRELNHLTPADFQKAEKNLNTLNAAQSRTATLVDAFEGSPRIKGLANRVQNEKGGEVLAQRTAGRVEDRQLQGKKFLQTIGPAVDEGIVANKTADAANSILLRTRDQANARLRGELANTQVAPEIVLRIRDALLAKGATQERPEVRDAYKTVADALVNRTEQTKKLQLSGDKLDFVDSTKTIPISELQELSFALKKFKDSARNPLAQISPSTSIPSVDLMRAVRDAESMLGAPDAVPKFSQAMQQFRASRQKQLAPLQEGPIGVLADRNPLLAQQSPLSRAERVYESSKPINLRQTIGSLQSDPNFSAQELARALMQRKLAKQPDNPGKVLRGAEGSLEEQKVHGLLTAAGTDTNKAFGHLKAADLLQDFGPATTVGGPTPMRLKQFVIRPFRTFDMATSMQTEEKIARQIAELLARNDVGGLKELAEIAQFDPTLRRMLIAKGMMQPAVTTAQSEGN